MVTLRGVSHWYGRASLRRQVLHAIDLEIEPGKIVILSGPSGCGKTTLLTLVGGLRNVQQGHLEVLGQALHAASGTQLQNLRRQIGFIFQAHNLLTFLTSRQNVRMSLELHSQGSTHEADARADEILREVGLAEHLHKFPDQLSGGQKQRVAIARALAARPALILADEPTAALDKQSGREVVEIMQRLAREQQTTVLLVTHDPRILDVADRIVEMEDGRLLEPQMG